MAIDATIGGAAANSYETVAEANAYFASRIPLVPPWAASGEEPYLLTATRLLDAMAQPRKVLIPPQQGEPAYYRILRQWTGAAATPGQRLAWPRVGMLDYNGQPLDYAITSVAAGNPAVVTTAVPHNRQAGDVVLLYNVQGTTPVLSGPMVVTPTGLLTFTVPVNVSVPSTPGTGTVLIIPQALKDAESEFAGQLLAEDRSLDNSVIVQGVTSVKAGSVAITFKNNIVPQVLPDAVINLMPQSWMTDELYVLANPALFDVISANPNDLSNLGPTGGLF